MLDLAAHGSKDGLFWRRLRHQTLTTTRSLHRVSMAFYRAGITPPTQNLTR